MAVMLSHAQCVNITVAKRINKTGAYSMGALSLRWRHNDSDGVSNHQPHDCLLNRLFGRISKKTSKLRLTGLCVGNSPGPVNSPHKGPVTRKMFPFDDFTRWRTSWWLHALAIFLQYSFFVRGIHQSQVEHNQTHACFMRDRTKRVSQKYWIHYRPVMKVLQLIFDTVTSQFVP